MSQAVVNLNKNNDPNFDDLMSMMLGIRALDPALVADAVGRSFSLAKKIICRSLERYILTPVVHVARHQNILDKLSQEVTGKHPIDWNWDKNVVSKHLKSHNLRYHEADIHP